jgi:2-dehydropantoate 2-reductase
MRSYAVIGTGALGGFYGAKLQRAGADVHFLVNSDYDRVKTSGLIIRSKDGDFALPQVHAYAEASQMPSCDVVLICLKTTHNHLLPSILPAIVKPSSIVVVMQNGLGTEAEIAQILPQHDIFGGLCFICSNKVAPGEIHHLDYGQIKLGAYTDGYRQVGITPIMELVAEDFRAAQIEISLNEDLLLARWQKLVWNIPYNGLSVVLDATTDRLMADPHTCKLVTQLMDEIQLIAAAYDRQITDEFIRTMLAYTIEMTPYRTSMKIDYDEGRPLEIAAMFEAPLAFARSKNIDVSRIEMLTQQLQFLNDKRSESGLCR